MSFVSRRSLVALSLVLAGCSAPPASDAAPAAAAPAVTAVTADTAAIRATLEGLEKQYSAAYQKGDAAAVAALYTEDGASVPTSGDWQRGREAIAKDQKTLADYNVTAREDVPEEITIAGDHAVEIGHYSWSGTAKKGGAKKSEAGRYVVLWRKDVDGTWRIHRDFGSAGAPAKP